MINTIKNSHRIIIWKVRTHTNITGNEEADKLAKQGANTSCIISIPFHLIGHRTSYQPSIPPTSTQHDEFIHNVKKIIEKEHESTIVAQTTNTLPYANKWLSNIDLPFKWSNLFWDTPWIIDTLIMQVLKFRCGRYLGNYQTIIKNKILKQDITPPPLPM